MGTIFKQETHSIRQTKLRSKVQCSATLRICTTRRDVGAVLNQELKSRNRKYTVLDAASAMDRSRRKRNVCRW